MTNAVEQFVNDFTLVVDNDQEAYNEARETVASYNWPSDAGEALRDQYEDAIGSALDLLRNSGEVEDVTVLLMSQLLQGWGSEPFYAIAKHYMEKE